VVTLSGHEASQQSWQLSEDSDRDSLAVPIIRAVDGATHSQKVSMEANVSRSPTKVLTKHAVMMVRGFELAPRPGIFTILDFHKMDVPLIGHGLTGVLDHGQRLVGCCCS